MASPWRRAAAVFAIAALLIAACGGGLFWYARGQVLDQQWRLLDALVQERLREISGWRHERSRDLRWLTGTPEHQRALSAFFANAASLPDRLAGDIQRLIASPPYDGAFIADAQGRIRYRTGKPLAATDRLAPLVRQAIRVGEPSFFDGVVRGSPGRELRILAMQPYREQGRVVGVVGLQIDPDSAEAPLVTAFPVADSSIEVLVFRPEGPRIAYLTGPRFVADREFSILPPPGLLAAQVLGGERRAEGVDYRNAPAMGIGAKVPGTPWHLIAKTDTEEVSGLLQRLAAGSAMLMLLLLSSAAYSARGWVREEQARSRAVASEAELSRLRLERRFELLSRYANDVILFADDAGHIRQANDRALEVYGYPRGELLTMNLRQLRSPAALAPFDDQYAEVRARGSALFETVHRRRDGKEFPAEVSLRLIRTPGDEGYLAVVRDVTERRRSEEQLRLAAQVFESSHEAILILDRRTRIVSANRAFTQVTGYLAEEVVGRSPTVLNSGAQDEAFYGRLWETVAREGHWAGTVRDRRKNGESFPLWLSVSAARDPAGQLTHYVAIATDMSEHEAAQQRIQSLAYHDPLTGLANRALLLDRMAQQLVHARRRRERSAVLVVDVDHFKNVNDSLGHVLGDALLRELGQRIAHCVRQDDTVARPGGDEFTLFIGELHGPDDARDVALKVLAEVSRPVCLDGAEVRTTATVGIALSPEDGEEPELLIRNANAALHHAKKGARGSFGFFVPEMNQQARQRLAMETRLRRAVERGEFELHYQPQVSARTGAMVRVEALLRWRTDERLINPALFVPLAEETGLIVPIGEWVAEEVCRQQQLWTQQGLPHLPVAFNVSGGQFKDPAAMRRLRDLLVARCRDPRSLEVELTEGVVMQDAEASVQMLAELKAVGIRLAIDDFGTGYSSLSYLRRFPIDRLKVDQSFVRRIPGLAADQAVVDAIITLARGLGLGVIAEGVENDLEAGFLRARDCDELQGYYFAAPMPAAELAAWWRANANLEPATG